MKSGSENVAVVLFAYNRPKHTRRVLSALASSGVEKIHVFQDGLRSGHSPADHEEVTRLIREIGFTEVVFRKRDTNFGLAKSIIEGVTEIFREYEGALVLEDDCVPSPALLPYVRFCLDRFRDEPRVFSVSGFGLPTLPRDYPYDACYSPLSSSWGWATWRNRWERFDVRAEGWKTLLSDPKEAGRFNSPGPRFRDMLERQMRGEIDSWAIRWYFTHFRENAVCVYPIRSYVQNIGTDGSGVHSDSSDVFDVAINLEFDPKGFRFPSSFEFDPKIRRAFHEIYNPFSTRRLIAAMKHPSNWPRILDRAWVKAKGFF